MRGNSLRRSSRHICDGSRGHAPTRLGARSARCPSRRSPSRSESHPRFWFFASSERSVLLHSSPQKIVPEVHRPCKIGRCLIRIITASCPTIKSANVDDKIMQPVDAELTMEITPIYTIRVNAENPSAPLISLAQKHLSQNYVSRFSCKGCTILTIREKKRMTATDNTFTYIGSHKSDVLALLHKH